MKSDTVGFACLVADGWQLKEIAKLLAKVHEYGRMTASNRVPGVVATLTSVSGATAYFSLMTDFHGCVKPSGRERTWPHRGGGSQPIRAARIGATAMRIIALAEANGSKFRDL